MLQYCLPVPAREAESLRAQLAAMKVERDFWVEQARALQNHLQTVLRGQASILEQMARSAVGADDVHAAIAQMGQELRQPLTTVEATVALAAAARDGSQGTYTSRHQDPPLTVNGKSHSEYCKWIAQRDKERYGDR